MGATIDYAIVYTTYYLESRENNLDVKESIINAYNKSICTILTSSSILIIATFLVGAFASGIVSKICKTLAQGVFCSTVLILLILPPTLAFVDKFIMKKKEINKKPGLNSLEFFISETWYDHSKFPNLQGEQIHPLCSASNMSNQTFLF